MSWLRNRLWALIAPDSTPDSRTKRETVPLTIRSNSTFAVAERREKEGFYSGEWIDPTPAFGLNIQAKLVLNFGKALRFSLIGDRSE